MTPANISCPYCNATLTPDQLRPMGEKIACARCGEILPALLIKDLPIVPTMPAVPQPRPRPTNRKIGFLVLSIMMGMAILGLIMALATVHVRREHDYRGKKEAPPPSVPASGELEGLGFLPPEANLVAVLRVADLLKDPTAKLLLQQPRPALLELLLGAVEKRTRLNIEAIDYVVVGAEIRAKLPQVTMVIATRQPYEAAELENALRPAMPTPVRGKSLYRFDLNPGKGMLWCPQPRILVLLLRFDALTAADLDAIPLSPRRGAEAPPPAIRSLLTDQRVNLQSLAWAAGELDGQNVFKDMLSLAPRAGGVGSMVAHMQSFGLSLLTQDGLTLVGYFKMENVQATAQLEKILQEHRWPHVQSLKVTVPEAAQPQWVRLQLKGEADSMRAVLGNDLGESRQR